MKQIKIFLKRKTLPRRTMELNSCKNIANRQQSDHFRKLEKNENHSTLHPPPPPQGPRMGPPPPQLIEICTASCTGHVLPLAAQNLGDGGIGVAITEGGIGGAVSVWVGGGGGGGGC